MKNTVPTAYPLQWPATFPRVEPFRRERGAFRITLPQAMTHLEKELRMLGATNLVLSSNYTLGSSNPEDPAVCAYFTYNKLQMAIPCDRWLKIEGNVRAIALTVNAIRGMARWGAKSMIQAMFTGFKALPAPANAQHWSEILAVSPQASSEEVSRIYRAMSRTCHPDQGGTTELMTQLNAAYAAFKVERDLK